MRKEVFYSEEGVCETLSWFPCLCCNGTFSQIIYGEKGGRGVCEILEVGYFLLLQCKSSPLKRFQLEYLVLLQWKSSLLF